MKNNIVTKNIKKKFNTYLKEYGFTLLRGTYVKEENDVLQIISIDSINLNLYCHIAIQPLYIPNECIVLSLGNRINKFYCNKYFKTIESLDDLEILSSQIKELLVKNVFPWFNDYASSDGIIRFIEHVYKKKSSLLMGFSPYDKNLHLGFSYLYNKQYEEAVNSFNLIIQEYENDNRDWVNDMKNMLFFLLKTIETNTGNIDLILQNYIRETKQNLGL